MILGTINTFTSGTGITLQIDGETSATTKAYMWLAPYLPEAGDRVLVAEVSGSYVILGKVVNNVINCKTMFLRSNISGSDNGYVSFGIKNGDLYFGLAPKNGASYTLYKLAKG